MHILGIDPGLATIGLGVIECGTTHPQVEDQRLHNADWLTIQTKAGNPLHERLLEIERDLGAFLQDTKPDLAVIEKLFFATNERTAIDVAQARGVILCTVASRGIPIIEPTPLQLKLGITGDGQADKLQMQTMLKHMLQLADIPRPDDAADALALAVYGALQRKSLELGTLAG